MIRLRTLIACIITFIITVGALAGGWYALLSILASTLFAPIIPTFGLSVITAKWWFPFVRWSYRSYIYPMSPSYLPSPNQLQHALNPPGLLKAIMAMLVWFYTPLVTYKVFRWLWNNMSSIAAPINDTTLQWTNNQVIHAERGEPIEPSHPIAAAADHHHRDHENRSLDNYDDGNEGFNKMKKFEKKSSDHDNIHRRFMTPAAASAPSA